MIVSSVYNGVPVDDFEIVSNMTSVFVKALDSGSREIIASLLVTDIVVELFEAQSGSVHVASILGREVAVDTLIDVFPVGTENCWEQQFLTELSIKIIEDAIVVNANFLKYQCKSTDVVTANGNNMELRVAPLRTEIKQSGRYSFYFIRIGDDWAIEKLKIEFSNPILINSER